VLEEDQEGKTFSRHLRYHLTQSATGTLLRVEADVSFKGPRQAGLPIASRDIKKRWQTSLEKLKAATAADRSPGA
jgi:hypothetical protein